MKWSGVPVCLGKSDRRRLLMDGGVLFQGCRLEVGGLLVGPRGVGCLMGGVA